MSPALLLERVIVLLFMSSSLALKVPCVKAKRIPLKDGDVLRVPGYRAEFQRARALKPHEEKQARAELTYRGTRTLLDEMTFVDPVLERTSLYDTAWAPDEIRDDVEKALLENPFFGKDYVLVEVPKVKAPWPGYNKIKTAQGKNLTWVAEQISARVKDLEIDPVEVIDYERQNEDRAEVIAALEELLVEEPADDTIEITV